MNNMMIQIWTCVLFVTLSGSSPVPEDNLALWLAKLRTIKDQIDQEQRGNLESEDNQGVTDGRRYFLHNNSPDESKIEESNVFNSGQALSSVTNWFLGILSNNILPAVSNFINFFVVQENNRRASLTSNFVDQAEGKKNIDGNKYPGRSMKNHYSSFYDDYVDQPDGKNSYDYNNNYYGNGMSDDDQLEYLDYPEQNVENGRRSLSFLAEVANSFFSPFSSTFNIQHQAELSALQKSRLDITANLEAKERQKNLEAKSLNEKLKNEGEINQLKMQLKLLKMQKDSDQVTREKELAAVISEEKLRALKEELNRKVRHDYELEVAKLHQEHSYQHHMNHLSNQEIVDRTVVQPIVEYRPALIKGHEHQHQFQFSAAPSQIIQPMYGMADYRPRMTESVDNEFENSHDVNFEYDVNVESAVDEGSNSVWSESS